jgi:magnesium transporter
MSDLATLLKERDVGRIATWLAQTSNVDIGAEIERLPPADRAVTFRLLPRERALDVFEMLDPAHQQELLEGLRDDRARQLVEDMEPDDRVRLLDEMPATVATRILAGLSPEERELTAVLLGYPENSAGRIMTPQFIDLHAHETVADALMRIRRRGEAAETVYSLPVTDRQRRLVGIVGLRTLVLAEPSARVGDLMTTDVHRARVDDDQEVAARLVAHTGVLALPVVDSEDRLVGVITIDDAMHIIESEDTEDISRGGGAEPITRPYLSVSVGYLARKRALWLLVLIVAAALTVNVLQFFEDTLAEAVTLALFIPLLIDTGGNSGAQSATAVIRAMALGELRVSDLPTVVWRECRVGLLLGGMLSVAVFVPVAVFFEPDLAAVVSLTLVTVCTWATVVGSLLPLVARRVGIDPAVVSAPLVTTLVDATGLVIYFLIAKVILSV